MQSSAQCLFQRMGVCPGRSGGRGVVLIPWTNVMTDQALGGHWLHTNCICVSPAGGIGCDAINTESWVGAVTFPAGWPHPTYEDSVTLDFAHFSSNKNTWKVYGTFLLTAHTT